MTDTWTYTCSCGRRGRESDDKILPTHCECDAPIHWHKLIETVATADTPEALIAERHTTHGDFADNARVSQGLKTIFHEEIDCKPISVEAAESLDMIALKLSRILSGRADEPDHWRDIAGYATLVVKELEKK